MNKIKAFIPNLITLGNLFCGCLGIYFVTRVIGHHWGDFSQNESGQQLSFYANAPWAGLGMACALILLAGVLDFFDGFVARLLGVQSPIGGELDSLADVVTFGVLPGFLMFTLMEQLTQQLPILCIAFFIPLCGAYRLAKFNVDTTQSENFKGLAIPAMALFIVGVAYCFTVFLVPLHSYFTIGLLIAIIIASGLLMVSNIPMFSFKMKTFDWKSNWFRYVLLIAGILLFIKFNLGAFALIIPIYIVLSLIARKQFTASSV